MVDASSTQTAHSQRAKLHVRLAGSVADLELLRPVSVELHAEARYRDIPYSHKKRDKLFTQALHNPGRYALLIAEYDRQPVGFLFCTVGEYIVGDQDLITTVYSFYVRRQYRSTLIGGKAALRLPERCRQVVEAAQSARNHDPRHFGHRYPAHRSIPAQDGFRRYRRQLRYAPHTRSRESVSKLPTKQLRRLARARRRPVARKLGTLPLALVGQLLHYWRAHREEDVLTRALTHRQSRAIPSDGGGDWRHRYRQIELQTLLPSGDPARREDHIAPVAPDLLHALEAILGKICRTRLSALEPQGVIPEHIDDPAQQRVTALLQGEQVFTVRTQTMRQTLTMGVGELWFINTAWWHSVANPGSTPRIALLCDAIDHCAE